MQLHAVTGAKIRESIDAGMIMQGPVKWCKSLFRIAAHSPQQGRDAQELTYTCIQMERHVSLVSSFPILNASLLQTVPRRNSPVFFLLPLLRAALDVLA